MHHYHISLNQFAEFAIATPKGKTRILEQQIKPNPILIPWYQSAKGSIKRFLTDVNNLQPILQGIKTISEKKPQNQRQLSDKNISIDALKKIAELKLEKYFAGLNYEVVKPKVKNVAVLGIDIGISPELIFKTEVNGSIAYGGVKIHISKNKPFSLSQCEYVSSMLMRYIKKNIAKPGEIVIPKFCICIDVFGDKVVPAKANDSATLEEMKNLCKEIKNNWPN